MDETETKQTPSDRTADHAHYAQESRLHNAVTLTAAALKHGGLQASEAGAYLREVHATLTGLASPPKPEAPAAPTPLVPAVPIKKSVTDEHIISLIDGSKLQTLARHLKRHNHTPESYRAAYGLPDTYPMVAPGFSKRRAEIAKAQGLGNRAKAPPAAAAA